MKPAPIPAKTVLKDKSDAQIKTDVLSELEFEPAVKVTDIGVQVKKGVVTLLGTIASHGEKWHAVRAAKRVSGVQSIVDQIKIVLGERHRRTDTEITDAALNQLAWSTTIPMGAIRVSVLDGWITLQGDVEWWHQKHAAEEVMQRMVGITGITNQIAIRPLLSAADVTTAIRRSFERSALLDAKKVEVKTDGSKVTLIGTLSNNAERDEAERVAWAVPGVASVDNQIKLQWWGVFN